MTSGPPDDEHDVDGRRDPGGPRTPDSPDERMAAHDDHTPDGKPAGPPGPDAGTGLPGGLDAEMSSAEEVLRHLLHDSVRDIEPAPGALEHLRRAVPARRAHRRQAMVGAAASLLLAVAAVPALIHTTGVSGNSAAPAGNVSAHHTAQGGEKGHGRSGGHSHSRHGGGSAHSGGKGRSKSPGGHGQPGTTTAGPSMAPSGGTFGTSASPCAPTQLSGTSVVGPPDGDGKVYGTFTVSNTSQTPCTVSGAGTVTATAQGNADSSHVSATAHTPGDPATGLPDGGSSEFVLSPGQSFQVKFGWVPASGTTGCTPTSQPTSDGGTGDAGGQNAGAPASDPSDETPPGSVAVTYTSAPGAAASGTVQNVCAGTVYYTQPIVAAQQP